MPPSSTASPAKNPSAHLRERLDSPPPKKIKPMIEIMAAAKQAQLEEDHRPDAGKDYENLICEQCGSGEKENEILLCDRCDKGFHMLCLSPIVVRIPIGLWFCPGCAADHRRPLKVFSQKKIDDFFRIQKSTHLAVKCVPPQDIRRRRKRTLGYHKKRRKLLPFTPAEDPEQRLVQMGTLATALTALHMEFSNELTYAPSMACKHANQAKFENDGMQVLSKEDTETLEECRSMCRSGLWPPLIVKFDSREGYTVEADAPIKDMTLIAEYTGDVDYITNRQNDDCDSMMTLLLAADPSRSLVICPDKRGNIARFINGINNHTSFGRKKQNVKCVRYNVNGECRVLLVAIRDIAKGERLYYDYNGYEHEYPTHHFL